MPSPGQQASAFLALAFDLVAIGIFLPAPYARVVVIMAAIAATASWAIGEDFGAIFTGSATDLNTGPLLVLLAVAYWPARPARRSGQGNAIHRPALLAALVPRPTRSGLSSFRLARARGTHVPPGAGSPGVPGSWCCPTGRR